MKKLLFVLSCTAAMAANAANYVWTGAQDAYWTNAANWKVDGEVATTPPGSYLVPADGGFVTNGLDTVSTDVAVFGGVATSVTTINLDGEWGIKNIVITNGEDVVTPSFTFGTVTENSRQYLVISGKDNNITIAPGVTADQTVQHVCWVRDTKVTSDEHAVNIWNNSDTSKFHLKGLRRITKYENKAILGANGRIITYGVGEIRLEGSLNYDQSSGIYLNGTGLFYMGNTVNSSGNRFARFQSQGTMPGNEFRQIEVPTGAYVNAGYGDDKGVFCYQNTRFFGGGGICAKESFWNAGAMKAKRLEYGCAIVVSAGKTCTVDCNIIRCSGANGWYNGSVAVSDGGTLVLNGNNTCIGCPRFHTDGSKMVVNKIGMSGTTAEGWSANSCLGGGKELRFYNSCTLAYSGSRENEVTDRSFVATNDEANITMTFANEGGSQVTFNADSTVEQRYPAKTATMRFNAASAPIVYNGTFQADRNWKIAIAGSACTAIANAGEIPVTLENGSVLYLDDDHAMPSSVTLAGNAAISVASGCDAVLAALPDLDGHCLNFIIPEGASVKVTGKGAGFTNDLTVNGTRAKFDENGYLVACDTATWVKLSDGNWSHAVNWKDGKKPAAHDEVMIANTDNGKESYTITLDEDTAISSLTAQETACNYRQTLDGKDKTLTFGPGGYTVITNTVLEVDAPSKHAGGPMHIYSKVHLADSQRWLTGSVRGWGCSDGNNIRTFSGDLSSPAGVEWSLFGYMGYRFMVGSSENFLGSAVVGAPVIFFGTDQFHRLGTKPITLTGKHLADEEAFHAGTTNMSPSLTYVFTQTDPSNATVTNPLVLNTSAYVNKYRWSWNYSRLPVCMGFYDSRDATKPHTLTLSGGISGTTAALDLQFSMSRGVYAPLTASFNLFPDDVKTVIAGDGSGYTKGTVYTSTMIEIAHANALGTGNKRDLYVGDDGYWGMNEFNAIRGCVIRPGLSYAGMIRGESRTDTNGARNRQAFMQVGSAATPAVEGATTATFNGEVKSEVWNRHKLRFVAAPNTTAKFNGKITSVINGTYNKKPIYGYNLDVCAQGDVEFANSGNSFDTNLCVRSGRLVLDVNGAAGSFPVKLGGFVPTFANIKSVRCVCIPNTGDCTVEDEGGKYGKKITWKTAPTAADSDGVALAIGDLVLIDMPYVTPANGIWHVDSEKVWRRPDEIDELSDIEGKVGLRVKVAEGTRFGGKAFMLVTQQVFYRASSQYYSSEVLFNNSNGAPQFHLEPFAEPNAAVLAGANNLALTSKIIVTDNASAGASTIGSREGVSGASFTGDITLEKSVTLAAMSADNSVAFNCSIAGNGDIIGGGKGTADITGATVSTGDDYGFKFASGTLKVAASQLAGRSLTWVRSADTSSASGDTTGCLEVVGDLDLSDKTLAFEGFRLQRDVDDRQSNREWTIAKASGSISNLGSAVLPLGWSLALSSDGKELKLKYAFPGLILLVK